MLLIYYIIMLLFYYYFIMLSCKIWCYVKYGVIKLILMAVYN